MADDVEQLLTRWAQAGLIDMPLFLEPEIYVNVPLEATYQAAYRGVPQRWKNVLESIA